ncbi:hypothetical protein [Bordetella sp. FB-8]|uniref:hypothetical protein n=1 Tax=Bordetella sp. FB-8 TaxID=1159870 RepID=UPI00039C0DFD|nr:hypothetical protein [Bordetella sp. FB-8]
MNETVSTINAKNITSSLQQGTEAALRRAPSKARERARQAMQQERQTGSQQPRATTW